MVNYSTSAIWHHLYATNAFKVVDKIIPPESNSRNINLNVQLQRFSSASLFTRKPLKNCDTAEKLAAHKPIALNATYFNAGNLEARLITPSSKLTSATTAKLFNLYDGMSSFSGEKKTRSAMATTLVCIQKKWWTVFNRGMKCVYRTFPGSACWYRFVLMDVKVSPLECNFRDFIKLRKHTFYLWVF